MFIELKNTTFQSIASKILHIVTPLVKDITACNKLPIVKSNNFSMNLIEHIDAEKDIILIKIL